MFWGLIMEPNKRYTQVVEKPFHISQAAMDISTGDNDPCQVMVVVDGKNFLVCTLQKNKTIQVPLDLYFKAGDSIAFLTNGKCNVHLTGYLDPEFEEEVSDEEDSQEEEEEEAPALVPAKNKRKLENTNNATAKKAKKEKSDKKKATEDSSDSDDDEDGKDQLQKFLDGEDIDTDENDDSFNVNTSADASDSDEEESDDDEAEEEEEDDEDKSDQADTTLDTSQEEAMPDMSKLSKAQRRRLKKKLQKQQEKSPKQQEKSPKQVNGVDKAKKDKPEQKAEKKKPEVKKEAQDGHTEKKEKKSLSGGVFIEDLKVGNGPVAKPGKVVMVYYEGRLKQNNKMFDNCLKGPGFKFKLGAKEVISGWDVGVSGMKVGGKRKIICPPAMAYGAKGSPPVIPPNSTLVFEVELKNVK